MEATNGFKIFVVEDDPWYGQILEYHLGLNPDYEVRRFDSGRALLDHLYLKPNLVTLDFSLPDMNGDELYNKIRSSHPDLPVIVISSQEDIGVAVKLLKMGVSDYLLKDDSTKDLLWNSVIRIRENQHLRNEVETLKEELGQKFSFQNSIIGNSPSLQKVFGLMEKAIKTNINVSITGETGTGKEVVAKAIHYNSKRKKKKFVAVNMGAIPKDLIESELFGYEKGAFTGAVTRKIGKFEEAIGGTIFLDEIAEMDLNNQSKLLRVLQEREVTRIGGHEKIKVDVRLIVATHQNLAEKVKANEFREDLFFRIMGLPIALPPLRDRGNDILLLAKFFMDEFCKANDMAPISISLAAKDKLLKYQYPGNVRELKALIELAIVMSNENEILPEDISFTSITKEDLFLMEQKTLKEHTKDIIKYYLQKNDNDVMNTARLLDIGKSTIYKMLKEREL
ncbi:sigma-54-dependent Fis family transcriptional regulator [Echinicola strongylocentroti]|uniref:Sigma-54-dependent Fis family transcriptional regulator n=1 Tax=Echinicola strongylocentroti TaxID=1795355 RepID=A0A2Z4IF46_9BACT|nr:sigma-54 dependent transcriptional regulator [Echinicola strongylocentroti]AWW29712.1 sigma-54-dependent Fis family transcriptional regulator [Echinicola strongylocentroti]